MAELTDVLRRVQGLLAVADDPATPPEAAESYRLKAEGLMFQYKIEAATLQAQTTTAISSAPEWAEIVAGSSASEFAVYLRRIVGFTLHHTDCRAAVIFRDGQMIYDLVGYREDLEWAQMLATSALLGFRSKLDVRPDPLATDQVNAYHLRRAGWEGRRIAEALWGDNTPALRSKARSMFKREAIARGEDPAPLLGNGNSIAVYRSSYAEAFADEYYYRLARMARSRAEDARSVVLAGRPEAVAEALYAKYPTLRPSEPSQQLGDGAEDCERCRRAKTGYCRRHSYLKPTAYTPPKQSAAGLLAGADAARRMSLTSGARGRLDG